MKWLRVLYVQVIIGIIVGCLVGFYFPGFSPTAKLISETFINLIKMLIAPIIFTTVVLGIAGVGNMKKVGRVGGKAILYFEVVTTIALLIGLVVANWVQPGKGVSTSNLDASKVNTYTQQAGDLNWGEFITHIVPSNIARAFTEGDILQILFFSVLFGVALIHLGSHTEGIVKGLDKLSHVLFYIMKMVMHVAPIGAFGGMAYTIGYFGLEALIPLGKLMISVYVTMAVFIFVVLNSIALLYGFSLWKLLVYIKNEILIVLGTSSSESVLPTIMQKLEAAGCKKSVVGLVIPTGYSFNLDGTTIYLSMATIFLAQIFDVPLSLSQQLAIVGVLMLTSKGAAAVTGGGFIVLASTLAAIKVIPVEGLALLLGVDRFMSEARSITNLIGNTVATVVVAKSEKEVDWENYKALVEKRFT
ncbi:MAG: C4-dicarboxylate transporter DctA [Bacteroidota bacterium]